jgi:hypothetical protein
MIKAKAATTRGNDCGLGHLAFALWYTVVYKVCNLVVVFGYNGSYLLCIGVA